jgi:membrane protein YdbS with pleckstrin-like domain
MSQNSSTSFTNESIDIDSLPKYEEIELHKPHSSYWKIICINIALIACILGMAVTALVLFVEEAKPNTILFVSLYLVFILILVLLFRASFKKRGYAIRTHDVIYKSGIIAETTTIIPLNRIQHIELNEGIFSRAYKLGALQIFTAGGQTGHLHISGIPIEDAKNIRDLLLKKLNLIENQVSENKQND